MNDLPEPGWYHDPEGLLRWWDGTAWGQVYQSFAVAGSWPVGFDGRHLQPPFGNLASPGKRILGRIIDFFIVVVPVMVLAVVISIATQPSYSDEYDYGTPGWSFVASGVGSLAIMAISLIGPALYEIMFVALKGATPGKMLVGVRVVQEGTGAVPGWGPAALRWAPSLVSVIPCVGTYLLAPALWIWALVNLFANPKRQTPFDLCANTVVIDAR